MLKNSVLKSKLNKVNKAINLKRTSCENNIRLIYVLTNTNRHRLNKYLLTQT